MSETIQNQITRLNDLVKLNDPKLVDLTLFEREALSAVLAIIERLPKTADGVPVTPGIKLFCPSGHDAHNHFGGGQCYCTEGICWDDFPGDKGGTTYPLRKVYSSSEAAIAAKNLQKEAKR